MQVLSAEIVNQWDQPFALGCSEWRWCNDGTWFRQCGDVALRVDVYPGTLESKPLMGCFIAPFLLGSIRLRVDGALLPLSEATLIALWQLVDSHLITVGIIPKRPVEFPLHLELFDFTKPTKSGVLFNIPASQFAIEKFRERLLEGTQLVGEIGRCNPTKLKNHVIDAERVGIKFDNFEFHTSTRGNIIKISAQVTPFGPQKELAAQVLREGSGCFGMRYTHFSDPSTKLTLRDILTWSLLPNSQVKLKQPVEGSAE